LSSASAPARHSGRPVLVLVGPPGAGKTSVGRRAAERLGVDFRDTDTDIEEVAGKPVRDIFLDEGEEHFRALEREAVTRALREHTGVLALGGGAVLAPALRDALRGHTVVFLSVGLADAVERVGLATARPVLMLNPRATLKTLLDVRRPLYEQVASATVVTDGRAVDDVVTDVLRVLDR
jgi:shikimate kinase